jgi:tRNA pseudouridine55 synthase
MEGFLNIFKPKGITSFGVVKEIRKRTGEKKVGHAGNLDPHATGVLVVGVGKATRFISYIMNLDKEYIAKIKLGILTDTLDITGEILMTKEVPNLGRMELLDAIKSFEGEILQIPPAYSAVRIEGKRLYDLAREGVLISPKAKKVKIYSIELLTMDKNSFSIRVTCSKGTYIRSLARDIAERLGTVGIVEELERVRIGNFKIDQAVQLDDPDIIGKIIPIDKGLEHLPEIVLKERASVYFRNGNRVSLSGILRRSSSARSFDHVRVYDETHHFIGIGFLKWDGVYPKKVIPT